MNQQNLEIFVELWQQYTVAEVAAHFGISTRDASAIATSLRLSGVVKLRDQRRVKASVDFDALAEVAREAEEAGQ